MWATTASNTLERREQTSIINITDVIDKKVKAQDYVSSQYYGGTYSRKRSETDDGAHGNKARVAYAEQFQRFFPMVRYALPITDSAK